MGATLSPFRYVQLAKHLFQRWIDQPVVKSAWKGKGKAQPLMKGAAPLSASARTSDSSSGASSSSGSSSSSSSGSSSTSPAPEKPNLTGNIGAGSQNSRHILSPDSRMPAQSTEIYRLMNDERLLHPGRNNAPKEIIVLCHGLYGFSTATPIPLFPSLKLHYWASVLEVLRDRMGCKVMVVGVKGTGSIQERAEQMHAYLKDNLPKGTGVNFVAHSMGGLDVRYLISHLKPITYTPLSLTSIGTPHRGSPFMDWCAANIGVGTNAATAKAIAATAMGASAGKALPFSLKSPLLSRPPKEETGSITAFTSALTSYLLNIFDSPAYSNLTTNFLSEFNPSCPDSPNVKYTSVAGRTRKMSVLHPLWFPKLVLDAAAENGHAEDKGFSGADYEGNDGLVSVSSARWGEFIGAVDPCHHWDLRGEGGLWPQGPTLEKKPQGRPDSAAPGGWDWQGSLGDTLGLGLNATSSKAEQTQKDADKVEATMKDKVKSGTESTWELAQVGQVLDYVRDLLPGGSSGQGTETEKINLANAKKEKEGSDGPDANKSGFVTQADGTKRRKDKFDLARFYGGLMLKLKDDGY